MTKKAAPLGHIRHLLHKATLTSGGNRVALPNTQKQTQGHSQNKETKKQRKKKKKEQEKSSEKELNEMEINKLSGTEFETMVIRMLKELQQHKKGHGTTKNHQ